MYRTYCRKCGEPIDFVITAAKKYMPVELESIHVMRSMYGNMTVITKEGKVIRAIRCAADTPGKIEAFVPHWLYCNGARKIKQEHKDKAVKKKPEPVMRKPVRENGQQLALF